MSPEERNWFERVQSLLEDGDVVAALSEFQHARQAGAVEENYGKWRPLIGSIFAELRRRREAGEIVVPLGPVQLLEILRIQALDLFTEVIDTFAEWASSATREELIYAGDTVVEITKHAMNVLDHVQKLLQDKGISLADLE